MKIIPYFPRSALCLLTTALVLSACASPPQDTVKDKWATTISSYGMIPIYPMREDIMVGDVRMADLKAGPVELGYYNLGNIDPRSALESYYKERMVLPETKAIKCSQEQTEGAEGLQLGNDGAAVCWTQPTSVDSLFAQGGVGASSFNRLRLAALPDISIVNLTSADLGAGLPTSGVAVALGLAAQSSERLSIKLRAIETLELPLEETVPLLKAACRQRSKGPIAQDILEFAEDQLVGETAQESDLQLLIITRVFYARAIEYSLALSDEAAANLSAALASAGAAPGLPDQSGVQGQRGVVDPEGDVGEERAKPLRDLSAGLNSLLGASASPGVVASFSYIGAEGLTLKEVFQRPMAFGVQTVALSPLTPCNNSGDPVSAENPPPGAIVLTD